jgi:cytochrome c biogenesis protein CcmG, thiol:disulfide interchange protein DsbE
VLPAGSTGTGPSGSRAEAGAAGAAAGAGSLAAVLSSSRRRSVLVGLALGLALTAVGVTGLVACGGGSDDDFDARLVEPGEYQEPSDGLTVAGADGERLPGLELTTFAGTPFTFDDLAGKPAVINFWASYCAPCVKEMPAIEAVHRSLGDEVTIVGVNNQDRDEKADEMATKTGVTYLLVRDPRGDAFFELGLTVMPTTLFVDADGTVVATEFGELTEDELTELITSTLL